MNRLVFIFTFSGIETSVQQPQEVLVDEPEEMFHLADLVEGVSVDCPELCSVTHSSGIIVYIRQERICRKYNFFLFKLLQ